MPIKSFKYYYVLGNTGSNSKLIIFFVEYRFVDCKIGISSDEGMVFFNLKR